MIMKEKLPFRFEEHTLQFTVKITLNIEMQSNLNFVREAENLGQEPTVSLYEYMKRAGMFVGKFDQLFYSCIMYNITNNTATLILGEKVDFFLECPGDFSGPQSHF